MKIKNISCTQFAGIRGCNVSFTDGLNVIYGKNESGKSTLINLISRTLFQNARIDGRSDKEFRDLYFPSALKGNTLVGDFTDGKISFETPKQLYTLAKQWGTDSSCTLSMPDGVVRDQKAIDAILREALLYGEGVYCDMLFSSQRNTDSSLQTILDASKKTDAKQEIVDVVSQMFAESGGISVNSIEQAINSKIDGIAGKHWDFCRDAPVRKEGRWSNGLGEILKTFYALEDAERAHEEISKLESEADITRNDYAEKNSIAQAAEEAYTKFNAFARLLTVQKERQKIVDRSEVELQKIATILSTWPKLAENLEKAKALQIEKANRELCDKYNIAKKIVAELTSLDSDATAPHCPGDDEIVQVKTAQREITALENMLCGMNLAANIHMLGGNIVEITSLRTGETLEIPDGNTSITEAVEITVPGVVNIQLAPANVDVADIEAQIAAHKAIITNLFEKYRVQSLDALEALAKKIADAKEKAETTHNRLTMLLGTTTFEDLEITVKSIINSVRSQEEIERDLFEVCGSDDVAKFVIAKETVLEGYATEYDTINNLKRRVIDLKSEITKGKQSIAMSKNIPTEYLDIADPEIHLDVLQKEMKRKQEIREAALTAKTAAASKLENYKEKNSCSAKEDMERAEQAFEEQKSLLYNWQHIAEAFKKEKVKIRDNPMQNIADLFMHYLDVISSGKVSSAFPEANKLNMSIYSDNRLLDYDKLSEGTKETISLAFRLSVLDHLFPDGGGVIVLDDPFADMDAERTAQSCKLIKESAARHQVIFLTCNEEYINMLNGNNIHL